jgi:hypothetical protein
VTRRKTVRLSVCGLAGLAIVSAVTAGSVAASSPARPDRASPSTSPARPIPAALERAFETARHIPGTEVGGVRSGTLHVGSAAGHKWAIASFVPANPAAQMVVTDFQDGAATGVFTRAGGTWRLVRTGFYGCGDGLPASLRTAWQLTDPAACTAYSIRQRDAAQRALAAMPAAARTAAAAAARTPGTAKPAATSKAATDDLGQTIAAIALSQVGVGDTPAVTNFNGVDCNPYSTLVAGFSANSDGCSFDTAFGVENDNETWCADFNKWVWEQAGITTDLNALNAGALSFYDWAVDQGQRPQPDSGTPRPGDSVVFFSPHGFPTAADHVGIVASVSSNGTIDMVNGDFAATPDVHVEYDTGIKNLSSFAASVWGPGEEWAIVTPPASAQQPAPTGQLSGPPVAVTGTTGSFRASGTVPGGSVTGYYWTFGDGRTTNAAGREVTHVFSEPGTYTVSATLTSSFGTTVTLRRNISVLAPSAGVASFPYDGNWYDPLPILQDAFTRAAGGLAVDSWDGGSWLRQAVPGDPSGTGTIAALSYPDHANADAMTPHAYYRAADGSLAETYQTTSGWVTKQLPGEPAVDGAIVATTMSSGGPAVFFIDRAGNLAESVQGPSGGWTTSEPLPGSPAVRPASLSLADTTGGPEIFGVSPVGAIRVFSSDGGSWSTAAIQAGTSFGGKLAALTTPDGHAAVVFVNARGGRLAEATQDGATAAGTWHVTSLPGAPRRGSSLAATTYLLPSAIPATPGSFVNPPGSAKVPAVTALLGTEAFYLTASGSPGVAYNSGTGWHATTRHGTATGILAATAYQVAEEPSNLFLTGPAGLAEETTGARSGDPSGTWTSLTMPDTNATWADRVVLYAADPADAAAAHAAAAAAGLPAGQVITSFSVAWADTLSGEYLVIAVGSPAVAALSANVCGWPNPSAMAAGATSFSYRAGPVNALPGADAFVNSAAGSTADTKALATDNAFYALRGTLPRGVTSVPAAVSPTRQCTGSPS